MSYLYYQELVKRGAKVNVYNPKTMQEAKEWYLKGIENIEYCSAKYEVLKNAAALILLTEWKEFRSPDFEEIRTQLVSPVIFDGRNQYNAFKLK
jgi:UDPglucose 6-dehydrogenase